MSRWSRPTRGALVSLLAVALTAGPVAAVDTDGDGLRDAFERKNGMTSPDRADTDRDGVIDSAEDHDRDDLADLGEQRFKTDPGDRDTDGDGILDGFEDSDGDGTLDRVDQHRRPVPADVRPKLQSAVVDVARDGRRCGVRTGDPTVNVCRFGKLKSKTDVVLIGDSKATMYLPPMQIVAEQEGWRLTTMLKGRCTPVLGTMPRYQRIFDQGLTCARWRSSVFERLRKNPPEMIVLVFSDDYALVDKENRKLNDKQKEQQLESGLRATLRALPRKSTVVLLADAPRSLKNPPNCLRQNPNDMSACLTLGEPASARRLNTVQRRAMEEGGGVYRTLEDKICPSRPCPLVQGDILVNKDKGHLTVTFTRKLAPSLRAELAPLLAPPTPKPTPTPAADAGADAKRRTQPRPVGPAIARPGPGADARSRGWSYPRPGCGTGAGPLVRSVRSPARSVSDAVGAAGVNSVLSMTLVLLLVALAVAPATAATDSDGDGLRDGFEARHGLTSASDPDSDDDGVIDGAEDHDNDRLSDRGEQRFGTNPRRRDTDRDGILDGREDDDGDGRRNAVEQDQRPMPRALAPGLAAARADVSPYKAGCQATQGQSAVVTCSYGPADSDTSVVLMGDSHAMQLATPIVTVARENGWRLTTLVKKACPPILGIHNLAKRWRSDRGHCRVWRRKALAWLKADPPDHIILAHSDAYAISTLRGKRIVGDRRAPLWRSGVKRTVRRMPAASKVLVLGDTPENRTDPVACLKQHPTDMSQCTTRRKPLAKRAIELAIERGARAAGADYRRFFDKVCSYDPCPIVQGRVLMYRDRGHLTATFAERLTPTFRSMLGDVIGRAGRHD